MVSVRVPLRFKRSIPRREHLLSIRPIRVCTWKFSMDSHCLRVGKRVRGLQSQLGVGGILNEVAHYKP
jgi:hypothetical protein